MSQHQAVFQFQFYLEVAEEQEFFAVDGHGSSVLGQIGQHEQLHTILHYLPVRGYVPAGDSGIDRYLSRIATSRRE